MECLEPSEKSANQMKISFSTNRFFLEKKKKIERIKAYIYGKEIDKW